MKDERLGESLWFEWDGNLYEPETDYEVIYYTLEHVDLQNDVVKRALASSLQRDGVSDSLATSFKLVESSTIFYGWIGWLPDESEPLACDEDGETFYGDIVEIVYATTFVNL